MKSQSPRRGEHHKHVFSRSEKCAVQPNSWCHHLLLSSLPVNFLACATNHTECTRNRRCTSLCRCRSANQRCTEHGLSLPLSRTRACLHLSLGAFLGHHGFLPVLTAAPELATPFDWTNCLLHLPIASVLCHNWESLHLWIRSHCGCGQHVQLSTSTDSPFQRIRALLSTQRDCLTTANTGDVAPSRLGDLSCALSLEETSTRHDSQL